MVDAAYLDIPVLCRSLVQFKRTAASCLPLTVRSYCHARPGLVDYYYLVWTVLGPQFYLCMPYGPLPPCRMTCSDWVFWFHTPFPCLIPALHLVPLWLCGPAKHFYLPCHHHQDLTTCTACVCVAYPPPTGLLHLQAVPITPILPDFAVVLPYLVLCVVVPYPAHYLQTVTPHVLLTPHLPYPTCPAVDHSCLYLHYSSRDDLYLTHTRSNITCYLP